MATWFATPENLAAVSGLLADFLTPTAFYGTRQINGRPYASLVCAGSDGTNAARQIARIATGWRLRPVADPLIVCTPRANARGHPGTQADFSPTDLGCRAAGERPWRRDWGWVF